VQIHDWRRMRALGLVLGIVMLIAAGCAGASPATTEPSTAASPTPSESASVEPSPTEDAGGGGEPAVEGPADVEAGAEFEVSWTGPDDQGDYIAIVPEGATEWTSADPWFYTANANPGTMVAPTADGEYELWYVAGADEEVLASSPITITPFEGALLAPDEVPAGEEFEVAWNGPDGPGDYVTIVAEGTDRWSNESYFYTSAGDPGTLIAPIEGGAHEIWYVTADGETQSTRPVTVADLDVTLDAPDTVAAGADFEVEWTGPDGPSDYITIVPAGSAEGAYLDYAYTTAGSPAELTAPDEPGAYEIWYASDRVEGTFESRPIIVN
jgi:Ca-activated chloride channel homolog